MKWFDCCEPSTLIGLKTRDDARNAVASLLTDLNTLPISFNFDTDDFDIYLFKAIHRVIHLFVHKLSERTISPFVFISECGIFNDNTHTLILYITNVVYRSLMREITRQYPFVIYDNDVYCCNEIVEYIGSHIVDNVTDMRINFLEPLFAYDFNILINHNSTTYWKEVMYDDFFTVVSFDIPVAESFFDTVITYYEKNDIYHNQRNMLKEWEQQIKEREQQIEEKENNFDNDCAAYEMEATKWQRNQMSILASKEQLLNQELTAILKYKAGVEQMFMTREDFSVK